MNLLTEVMNDIHTITYTEILETRTGTSTQETAAAHEDLVVSKFVGRGFREFPVDKIEDGLLTHIKKGNIWRLRNKLSPGNWFIRQPGGTQSPPDIFVQYNGGLFWFECKTGNDKITMNDSLPAEYAIYIITDKVENQTCFRLGSDMIDPVVRRQLEKEHKEDRIRWEERKKIDLAVEENASCRWFNTPRPKYQQQGGREITNWVIRQDREISETHVFDHIDQESGTADPDICRYISTEVYPVGKTIMHNLFGKGVVVRDGSSCIEVSFDCGTKKIRHRAPIVINAQNEIDFTKRDTHAESRNS